MPNACSFKHFDEPGRENNTNLIFRAMYEILEDSEISTSYVLLGMSYKERLMILQENYEFECDCHGCAIEEQCMKTSEKDEEEKLLACKRKGTPEMPEVHKGKGILEIPEETCKRKERLEMPEVEQQTRKGKGILETPEEKERVCKGKGILKILEEVQVHKRKEKLEMPEEKDQVRKEKIILQILEEEQVQKGAELLQHITEHMERVCKNKGLQETPEEKEQVRKGKGILEVPAKKVQLHKGKGKGTLEMTKESALTPILSWLLASCVIVVDAWHLFRLQTVGRH
jgi:hypothetical protein